MTGKVHLRVMASYVLVKRVTRAQWSHGDCLSSVERSKLVVQS